MKSQRSPVRVFEINEQGWLKMGRLTWITNGKFEKFWLNISRCPNGDAAPLSVQTFTLEFSY